MRAAVSTDTHTFMYGVVFDQCWRYLRFILSSYKYIISYFLKFNPLFVASPKLRKAPISFTMFVRPHVSALLPLDESPWNFIRWIFTTIGRDDQISVKIGQNIGQFRWRPSVRCIVTGDIKSPQKIFEWNGIKLIQQPKGYKHYANAEQCYDVRTLADLSFLSSG